MVKNTKTTKSAASAKSTGTASKPDKTTTKMADSSTTEKTSEQREMDKFIKAVENKHKATMRRVAAGTTNAYKKKKKTRRVNGGKFELRSLSHFIEVRSRRHL
jgi:hypothetical protein